jgi:hypothetical protein
VFKRRQVQLVPPIPPILPPLQQQHLVTVQSMQPMQPMQPAPAQLKWLLEQVHTVRSRSVNTQPSICRIVHEIWSVAAM